MKDAGAFLCTLISLMPNLSSAWKFRYDSCCADLTACASCMFTLHKYGLVHSHIHWSCLLHFFEVQGFWPPGSNALCFFSLSFYTVWLFLWWIACKSAYIFILLSLIHSFSSTISSVGTTTFIEPSRHITCINSSGRLKLVAGCHWVESFSV